jgi:transposase
LFVFRSRRGDRLKILVWERDGFLLWYKRLEAGVFKLPKVGEGSRSVEFAGERVSNDPGWHRCFETETRAALRTEREKWQRKRPKKIAAQKKKKEKEKSVKASDNFACARVYR